MAVIRRQKPSEGKKKKIIKKSSSSLLSQVQQLDFSDEGISVALYGRGGTGKTALAGTFPGKILWLICSASVRPGELRTLDTPAYRKKIEKYMVGDASEVSQICSELEGDTKYNTVVLDHITGFMDKVLAEILGVEVLPEQKSFGIATQQDYNQATMKAKAYLRPFLDLACNRVLIGHERDFEKEIPREGVTPRVSISVTPALANWIETNCDYVCRTFIMQKQEETQIEVAGKKKKTMRDIQGMEYCLRVAPDPIYASRLRIPKEQALLLPEYIKDPSYQKLMEVLHEAGE